MYNTMSILQNEITNLESGILFSVKLTNASELSLLLKNIEPLLKQFYLIVKKACIETCEHTMVLDDDDSSKVYIIIQQDKNIADSLAYSMYSQVQLYVDHSAPESYLQCSVGSISFHKSQKLSIKEYLSRLSFGMINNKHYDHYYCYDDTPIDINILRQNNIKINQLRSSLTHKKARFAYQPVVSREYNIIEYHECLLRMLDPNGKLTSVGPIIEHIENKGLINIVDFTVIEMAIQELFSAPDISLSVNISNTGVLNQRLLKNIQSLLEKYPVGKRLIIEITETSFNLNFKITKKFIDTLHDYGCKFALDDFGAGFTSFRQLLNLPIDIVKIDGSYISSILHNDHNRSFVKSLIKLVSDLGMKSVAEFVETEEIARLLTKMKVDAMQGNFFLPASEFRLSRNALSHRLDKKQIV